MRYLYLLLSILLFSCDPDRFGGRDIHIYVPVYLSQSANTIATEAPKATVHSGKIYAYGNYLFQIEEMEGIHIIDNSNPQNAHKLAFLKVPSASEISIKGGFLYTNNINDLVVFDISNINSPQLVHRIAGAFPPVNQNYPPFEHAYFECVDPSRGTVISWQEKIVDELPKCRRN